MADKKLLLFQVIFYITVLSLLLLFFFRFTVQNDERIREQNRVYAGDAARATAARITEKMNLSQHLARIYSTSISHRLTGPEVSPQILREMDETSTFDAFRFTSAAGINYSASGKIGSVNPDLEFFKNGMEGKSGVSVVFNSELFHQTVLGFYAPLRYDGTIIGVLRGTFLADKYLRDMLSASFFGMSPQVYLCAKDGRIIASSGSDVTSQSIYEYLGSHDAFNPTLLEKLKTAFSNKEQTSFLIDNNDSSDNISVIHLPEYDYILVQIFPHAITQSMIHNANIAGFELEFVLIILFLCVAAWLIIQSGMRRKSLLEQNREFSMTVKGMAAVFSSRYCAADLKNGTYIYVAGLNPLYSGNLKNTGPYDALVKQHASPIIDPEERERFEDFFSAENLRNAFQEKDYLTYECHVMRNGRESWENVVASCLKKEDGQAASVLFMRQDVTDVKLREISAQKRLDTMDRKERQYRIALASNALFSWEFNVTDDAMLASAPQGERDLEHLMGERFSPGMKPSDIFKALGERVLPEDQAVFSSSVNMAELKKQYDGGQREVDVKYWLRVGEKDICALQSFYMTVDNATGDIMAMTVARDITAQENRQRLQTKALKDALIQARHANEAKTTFLSNMSHDIRTPMNAIIGFASIAASHLDNREQVDDCLRKVLSSSNHLLSLINDILDMSRIESGKMQLKEQPCNISELMHNLVTIIQPQVKAKQLQLYIDTFDVTNEFVIADPLKLNQVFINLLGNAVKYTHSGGSITFSIHQTPAFRHGYATYVFVVEDNGIGMSKDFVEHIFEPFTRESTTTRSGIQGSGLGMAITRNIIDMMDGAIRVESEKGKGSRFTITLTMKLGTGARHTEDDLKEMSGMRALVVDDDVHVCASVDKMLRKIGFRSEWTSSGMEAVYRAQMAVEDGDPYHIFILDWQMPDMNGLEISRKIRKAVGEDAPIIILTAYEWADIETEARQSGVNAFCAKPLFMSDLKNALVSTRNKPKPEVKKEEKRDFHGKRVLLVDDVEMNRELAEFILTESDFEVETAPDGTDAVEMVRESPENYYDVILMDVQMPTMNGYEATRAIRALDREDVKNLPIIAMTANALEDDKALALKSGMNAHIAKPIDIKKFFSVLEKFLQGAPE